MHPEYFSAMLSAFWQRIRHKNLFLDTYNLGPALGMPEKTLDIKKKILAAADACKMRQHRGFPWKGQTALFQTCV